MGALGVLAGRVPLAAQVPADSTPVIAHVSLDRHNVFDLDEAKSWPLRLVNKLHIVTQAPVIRNEFLFHVGERYDSLRVAETERNLLGLGVFRRVDIDSATTDSGLVVRVVTRDGWTTRPDFRFRSTGGSVVYTLALIEDNLLGTATQTQLEYRKDPDRSSTILSFNKRRLLAGKVGTTVIFADRSDGTLLSGVVAWPFFSSASKFGASIAFDTRHERVLRFRDGIDTASDTLQRRYVLGRLDVGRALEASDAGYFRGGLIAQVRRDDFTTQGIADLVGIPTRTVTGAAGIYLEARHTNIPKVHGFQSFGVDELVDLSNVARFTLLAAPRAFGYERDGIAPGLGARTGIRFRAGFAYADLVASGLFTRAGLDSGQVLLGGTAALIPAVRHQVLLHAEAGVLERPVPGSEFDLGLGAGPRAFREHAFTGDRQFFATAEYRYTLSQEFLKVTGIGLSAFVDHGGAWWKGQPARTGWDAGVGLRFGPSRAPDQEVTRIDLARRFASDREPAGWVLVVGKGFVFSTSLRGGNR